MDGVILDRTTLGLSGWAY